MQKRTGLALLLLVTVALAVGCGSAKNNATSGSSEQQMKGAPGAMPATAAPASGQARDASGKTTANYFSVTSATAKPVAPPMPGPGGNASVPEAGVARKEIKNASFDLKVKNVDEADKKLRAAVAAAGGFIQNSQVEGQKENGRRMTISIRVPAAGYDNTFSAIAGLGEEITRKEWTEDVTQEYYDLEARISVQEAHLVQLKKLYEKAGTIPEMIQLEQEIARVQAEVDSLKGRYQYLSNQVAFSTITVSLYEPGAPAPIQPPKTVWERMTRGFIGSANGFVNFLGNLLVFLVSAIPVVVPLGIVGGAGM
ncbi:MAG TPA: DUF4349 domain-containing protein, partial [Symbiobacteriaceae bacterium]|nr:DUF4349 domain-containing protein [Symbiobacteriaceae bacterium]